MIRCISRHECMNLACFLTLVVYTSINFKTGFESRERFYHNFITI